MKDHINHKKDKNMMNMEILLNIIKRKRKN